MSWLTSLTINYNALLLSWIIITIIIIVFAVSQFDFSYDNCKHSLSGFLELYGCFSWHLQLNTLLISIFGEGEVFYGSSRECQANRKLPRTDSTGTHPSTKQHCFNYTLRLTIPILKLLFPLIYSQNEDVKFNNGIKLKNYGCSIN